MPTLWIGRSAHLFKPQFVYGKGSRSRVPASTAVGPIPIISQGRQVSIETKTLVFNAAPLFLIAVAYAAVSVATLPAVWRSRSRATAGDVTVLAIFPAVAVIATLYGVIVADRQTPVQDHLWLSFATMVVALAPPRRGRPSSTGS